MNSVARCVMQQCIGARLMIKPEEDECPAEYVEVDKGVVVFICFMKEASISIVPKLVKSVLEVKLSPSDENAKRVSILDLPGDVLIVPQATLGGKMKGKALQYHNNVAKEVGKELYSEFTKQMQDAFSENKTRKSNQCKLFFGTYGNLQVLSMQTNGPYTHMFEF